MSKQVPRVEHISDDDPLPIPHIWMTDEERLEEFRRYWVEEMEDRGPGVHPRYITRYRLREELDE
jgi:hypothetical protein